MAFWKDKPTKEETEKAVTEWFNDGLVISERNILEYVGKTWPEWKRLHPEHDPDVAEAVLNRLKIIARRDLDAHMQREAENEQNEQREAAAFRTQYDNTRRENTTLKDRLTNATARFDVLAEEYERDKAETTARLKKSKGLPTNISPRFPLRLNGS